jgi:hypothetical protein
MMDNTDLDSVFYLSGSLLTIAGVFGCFMPRLKSGENHIPFDEEEMIDYGMNSELEMIEQVKVPDTRI